MNTYAVNAEYIDRRFGPTGRTIRVTATNSAGAIGKAGREFFKLLDRKQKFDANKDGVVIRLVKVKE
jgi:hypothetical protein